ncbi:HEAT repeat domain-containing protein [bacterium]|nr:HEAT repeat domain-containing protein [bacterium]
MDRDRIAELQEELVRERSMEALERLTGTTQDRVLTALIEAAGEIIDAETPQDEDDTILEEIQTHLVKCAETGPLVDALESKNASIREFALGCLGEMGDVSVAEHMIARLEDEEPSVREAASEHLSLLTDHDYGVDPAAWRRWLETQADLTKQREADEREESRQRAKAKTKVLDVPEGAIDEADEEGGDGERPRRPASEEDDDDVDDDREPASLDQDEDGE